LLKDAKSRMPGTQPYRFSALGSPHAAKRFIGLAIVVGREVAPHASPAMNIAPLVPYLFLGLVFGLLLLALWKILG